MFAIFEGKKELVSGLLNTAVNTVSKSSPEIALVAGIVVGVAAAVVAVKASKANADELTSAEEQIVDERSNQERFPEAYTKREKAEATGRVYGNYAGTLFRVYGPSVILGIGSVALLLTSNRMLRARNQALVAAVAAAHKSFTIYRNRVRAEYGDEVDKKMLYGSETKTITFKSTGEDGTVKKEKVTTQVMTEKVTLTDFQRVIDETTNIYIPDRERMMFTLQAVQKVANDRYNIYGYVLLNDVLKDLGLERTSVGAVTGWSKEVYEENVGTPSQVDNFIDFGLDDEINHAYNEDYDYDKIYLNFNVHGAVHEYIGG